jgi:curved DNA-binding protein CbpA
MGNSSGKYENFNAQNMQNESMDNFDLNSLNQLDPRKVLNLPKNYTWEQLKSAYREAALKTHPDKKGGNKIAFEFVTNCFKTLAEEYKAARSNKSHNDLKKESTDYFEKIVNNNMVHPAVVTNEPFEKRFNQAFDECKYVDEEVEFGYGSHMEKSSKVRDELSVKNVFANKDKIDNTTFNEVFTRKVPVSKEIVKYKDPEPMLLAKALKFTEIGGKKPDDYSSRVENTNLNYTDYMKAHSGMRLANADEIKSKTFKSVEDFEKYRDNKTKRGLTEKERRYMEEKKQKEEQEEYHRQERIRQRDVSMQLAFDKANRLLIK